MRNNLRITLNIANLISSGPHRHLSCPLSLGISESPVAMVFVLQLTQLGLQGDAALEESPLLLQAASEGAA